MKPPKITEAQFEAQKRVWVMCSGKVAFETEEKAAKRAQDLRYRHYWCPHCEHWHLTKHRKDAK